MAREEELKRVDLKVNVSCCEGCRRKVMKAISLKGVLRTEIHPSLDKVTVVGDVDSRVLVKKLVKVGKIAEVMAPPPPPAASSEEGKKSDGGNGGDKPAAPADEKSARKDEGKDGKGDKAAACKQECNKCTAGKEAARADEADRAGGKKTASKDSAAKSSDVDGNSDGLGAKISAPDHAAAAAAATAVVDYQYHHHYNRPEPAMVVPVHVPYYAANATPYYTGAGYYPMPPTMPMPMPRHPPQLRPQQSRFDEDFFNEDNTVGCYVM
ncbi:hypothetical protein E2562_016879 [Oryza meyeriana var. granulata]|uniref:HMA domain-containing protein n=1 Tax=Oryza meyeriana var. granulata TaxID=110450 RepID=A0A6G1BWT2_9ORYZ|nr:hypothetical protein E2562_016879 [Oryza meyeriana var. granulata]